MLKVLCLLLISFLCINSQHTDFKPVFYNQSNPVWGNITLGFGPATISQAGCLMTCVTSMCAGEGVLINGSVPTPPIMNQWLINNDGFADGDNLIWAAIEPLGFQFLGFQYNSTGIVEAFNEGNRVIINVMNGRHFVLVTGLVYQGYAVMDPAFKNSTYNYTDVSRAGIYAFIGETNQTISS